MASEKPLSPQAYVDSLMLNTQSPEFDFGVRFVETDHGLVAATAEYLVARLAVANVAVYDRTEETLAFANHKFNFDAEPGHQINKDQDYTHISLGSKAMGGLWMADSGNLSDPQFHDDLNRRIKATVVLERLARRGSEFDALNPSTIPPEPTTDVDQRSIQVPGEHFSPQRVIYDMYKAGVPFHPAAQSAIENAARQSGLI